MMRHYFGLGVGHTYAFNLTPQSLDQTVVEDSQDPVEEPDVGDVAELGPDGDTMCIDESDPERSFDGENTDSNTNDTDDDDGSGPDVESEDEDFLEREEMYA